MADRPGLTRRALLATVGGAAAGVAGCLGGADSGSGSTPAGDTPSNDGSTATPPPIEGTGTADATPAGATPTPALTSTLTLVPPWGPAFGTDGARVASRPADDGTTLTVSGRLVNRADPPAALAVFGYWLRTVSGRYCHAFRRPRTAGPGERVALEGSFAGDRPVDAGDLLPLAGRAGRAVPFEGRTDGYVVPPPGIDVESVRVRRLVADDTLALELTLHNRREGVFDPETTGAVLVARGPDGASPDPGAAPRAGNTVDRTLTVDPGASRTLEYADRARGVYDVADADFAYLLIGPPA